MANLRTDALSRTNTGSVVLQTSSKKKIVVVSGAWVEYREALQQHLRDYVCSGISITHLVAGQIEHVKHTLQSASAILIDWSIQYQDILVQLRLVRLKNNIPIIAMCNESEAEQITALFSGADFTVRKSLNPILLEAKLLAFWRSRSGIQERDRVQQIETGGVIEEEQKRQAIGPFKLDEEARKIYVYDSLLKLTPLEYDVVRIMLKHNGKCLERDKLINRVWGYNHDSGTNFLDVHIHGIRHKLKKAEAPACIETVRGVGYRLEVRE